MWTLTTGHEENYERRCGRCLCAKQSQFSLSGEWCARHILQGSKEALRETKPIGGKKAGGRRWQAADNWWDRAKQSQFQDGRLCETKPICPARQVVCTAHLTGGRPRGTKPICGWTHVQNKADLCITAL